MKRNYALFYLASLATLAQIVTAVLIEVPANVVAGVVALLLGLCAALFIYWSLFVWYKHGRIPRSAAQFPTPVHVDQGPYTIVRHPLYLGYILINLTFMLSNPTWLALVLGLLAIAGYYLYTGQEDKRLQAAYGAAYQNYMQRVPSLNPLRGLLRLLRA